MKEKLAAARKEGFKAVQAVEKELGDIQNSESGIVIDLFSPIVQWRHGKK